MAETENEGGETRDEVESGSLNILSEPASQSTLGINHLVGLVGPLGGGVA